MEELTLIDEEIIVTEQSADEWDNHIGDNISF
jgi:hypothetical protein